MYITLQKASVQVNICSLLVRPSYPLAQVTSIFMWYTDNMVLLRQKYKAKEVKHWMEKFATRNYPNTYSTVH